MVVFSSINSMVETPHPAFVELAPKAPDTQDHNHPDTGPDGFMKDLFLDQLCFFDLGINQFGNLVHARFGIAIVILTSH